MPISSDYRNLFPIKTPFEPTDEQLNELAQFMTSKTEQVNSKIPAGYTYLGQFIIHDISFDSARKDNVLPWPPYRVPNLKNLRTPFVDLDTLYGQDIPSDRCTPSRYDLIEPGSRTLLKLGTTSFTTEDPDELKFRFSNDLPRCPRGGLAQIVDERNDENLVVAQMQVAFIKFHNAIVAELGGADTQKVFNEARRLAIRHYQWIVLHDILPKIVKKSVWERALNEPSQYYSPGANPYIPFEFSVAAFRTGHSMIRNRYQWNSIHKIEGEGGTPAVLSVLKKFTGEGGMEGQRSLPSNWMINWNWFFDIDGSMNRENDRFNFAIKIDTSISTILGRLNPLSTGFDRMFSLSALDLYRGRFFGLPPGQALANDLHVEALSREELLDRIPGMPSSLADETPLLFYLLAEAQLREDGENLGELGSILVADILAELVRRSEFSILNANDRLEASPDFIGNRTGGVFGMAEMLKFVAYKNKQYDELDPTKSGISTDE